VFDTVGIFIREAARLVQHRAESLVIRLLAGAPAVVARVFALAGLAPRLLLGEAAETVGHIEKAAEAAVETAVEEAAVAGPLVLFRSARALAVRRRAAPFAALVIGAVGVTALALRRAARGRGPRAT